MVVVMTSDSDSDDCDDSIEGALLMERMYFVFIHSHASDSSGERLRSLLVVPHAVRAGHDVCRALFAFVC